MQAFGHAKGQQKITNKKSKEAEEARTRGPERETPESSRKRELDLGFHLASCEASSESVGRREGKGRREEKSRGGFTLL